MKNPDFKHISEIFESEEAKESLYNGTTESTLKPGHLNKLLETLEPGKIIVLGGRPGMGKTSTAIQLEVRVAMDYGKAVGFCTLELSSAQLTSRIVAFYAKTPSQSAALDSLMNTPIYFHDKVSAISGLEAGINTLVEEKEIKLLVIDYFQLLPNAMNQDFPLILSRLKKIAVEKNLSILILSQLSKTVNPLRPTRSDLLHLNYPDKIIDKVFFLLRPSYYNRNSKDHTTEIIT
jgi:replicative DNA helicase